MIASVLTKALLRTAPNFATGRRFLCEALSRTPQAFREADATLFTGQRVRVDLSEYVGQEILAHGAFERSACELVRDHLREGDVFLDVGGHLGLYTLITAQRVGPSGHVHVFEPGDKRRRLLEINVRQNSLANVTINPKAVGSHSGSATFLEGPARNLGTSRVVENADGAQGPTVQLISLDEYIAHHAIQRVAGVKVDVEGAEFGVFQGAQHMLAHARPRFILYESEASMAARYGSTPKQIHDLLRDHGYRLRAFVNRQLVDFESAPAANDFFATLPEA